MNKCSNCGHENRVGEILCQNCGSNIVTGQKPSSTKQFDDASRQALAATYGEQVATEASQSGSTFPENAVLRLQVIGSPMPINVKFAKSLLTLGRRDPATGTIPDIDLAPFAGYRMGVSRNHSELRRTDEGYLELIDLGSSNGTFINGQRLSPHTPYRVNDRDRLALGQIVIELVFQREGERKTGSTGPLSGGTKPLPPIGTGPLQAKAAEIKAKSEAPELAAKAPADATAKPSAPLGTVPAETPAAKAGAMPAAEAKPAQEVKPKSPAPDVPSDKPELGTVTQTKINPKEIMGQLNEDSETLNGVVTHNLFEVVKLSEEEREAIFGILGDTEDETIKMDKPSSPEAKASDSSDDAPTASDSAQSDSEAQ